MSYHAATIEEHAGQPTSRVGNRVIARDQAIRADVIPRMTLLRKRLSDFVDRLRGHDHAVAYCYEIPAVGKLLIERLGDFQLVVEGDDYPSALALTYKCFGKTELKVLPETSDAFFALKKYLHQQRMDFRGGIAGTVSKIALQPVVPVEARFEADLDEVAIRLTLFNLGDLGEMHYKLQATDFDAKLMAQIENLLLFEPSDFYGLAAKRRVANTVSD
jgi:hypothetical protein